MKLTFHGGAGSVTGANYLLEVGGEKYLVDCGLHQGTHYAEMQNFEPFPYDPKEIKAVFVTHAHIDHTGRLAKLYRGGFRGAVYSTPPTKGFSRELLLDSQDILGREAEREGRETMYEAADVEALMGLWREVDYHEEVIEGALKVQFLDAGHILGSSIVVVEAEGKKIVFSGDLGNYDAPIIRDTEFVEEADYCLIESTYGDRLHKDLNTRRSMFEDVIEDTVKRGGTLMIPAFAMERTQRLLYDLNNLIEDGRIPRAPVFIDSPLAIKLTEIYKQYEEYFDDEAERLIKSGDKLFNFPGLTMTLKADESRKINTVLPPKIIIAGSGMSQGGRILHHEKRYLPDPKSTILFIGYQAVGSLGRRILEGAKTVRIHHEEIPVRCHVVNLDSYSAHADQKKLLEWLAPMHQSLKKVFVVQGEEEVSKVLATRIRDQLAVSAVVPSAGEEVVI